MRCANVDENEFRQLADGISNWGRWGSEDERGTLNFITPAITQKALSLARYGDVIGLGKTLRVNNSQQNPASACHFQLATGPVETSAQDALLLNPHGFEMTHFDAVGHSFFDGNVYNGRRISEVLTSSGLGFASIAAAASGIVTRGVLLDVAEVAGLKYLGLGVGIGREDLEKCEEVEGVTIGPGDAIFVRSGLDVREQLEGVSEQREGVLPEILSFLHERDIAIYSGDCIERIPSDYPTLPMPFHQVGMAMMGLWFLDNPDIEVLATACRNHATFEFTLVIAPLNHPGGSASAVNPIAIF